MAYLAFMSASLLLVALARDLHGASVQWVGRLLMLMTFVLTGLAIVRDVQLPYGPDIGAIVIRVTALVVVAYGFLFPRHGKKEGDRQH